MRYLKVLFIALIFVVSLVFVMQNHEVLKETIQLQFNLPNHSWQTQAIPFYLLIVVGFLVGVLLSLLYFFAGQLRLSGQLRDCRARMARLEQENVSLRNTPVEPVYPAPVAAAAEPDPQA
jgi:putative membrane protein